MSSHGASHVVRVHLQPRGGGGCIQIPISQTGHLPPAVPTHVSQQVYMILWGQERDLTQGKGWATVIN